MAERDAVEQESETAAREGENPPGASQSRASSTRLQVAREAFTSEQSNEPEQPDAVAEQGRAADRSGSSGLER